MAIDYTKIDQNEVREELISLMKQTTTFKNADFSGTVLYELANNMSYVASLYGFYLNQIANEPFIDSAKQYKNVNRIASSLLYNPVGIGSAKVNVASSLSKSYVLNNTEGFIEIPSYSLFPSTVASNDGRNFSFTNLKTISIQVKQFGVFQIKETDIKYTGDIVSGTLQTNKLKIEAFTKKPVHFVDVNGNVITYEANINSVPDSNLLDFKVNKQYSLFFRNDVMVIGNKTAEIQDDEIARFKITSKRQVQFIQNFTNNRFYKGRLGFRNLEHVQIRAIPYPGVPNSVGKIQLVIPQDVPAFQILFNGEIFTFSNDREVIISSDTIPGSFFDDGQVVNIVLDITDPTAQDYGAKLVLKKILDTEDDDVVIAYIPAVRSVDTRGNLVIAESQFRQGETKSGKLIFAEGEVIKRVVFETPFDFGLPSPTIPSTSTKNYAVYLFANDGVRTFYSDKTTRGFKIHIEDGVVFEGDVNWITVAYDVPVVQDVLVDATDLLVGIDPTNYTIIIQPNINAHVWARELNEDNFILDSDAAFVGDVDFLIVPDKEFVNVEEPKEVGQVYFPKSEVRIEVFFNTPRATSDYQIFLQPSDNVNVWPSNKSSAGFIINVEADTDFFGSVDWQLYESNRSGTIKFGGTSGFRNEPEIIFNDLNETTNLGLVEQGFPKLSLIDTVGLPNTQVNSLRLELNVDTDIFSGLSFKISDKTISYNNIQVFVEDTVNKTWVEYVEANKYKRPIDHLSNVFYVRVDKDGYITVRFGDNDFRGTNPKGNKIAIIGLQTVGENGNIQKNILSTSVVPSLNFQVSDIITDQVMTSLLDILRIKETVFRQGATLEVLDYKGDTVASDDLTIVQLDAGYSGTNPESTEDIRLNSQFAYRSQNRVVTKEDYEKSVLSNFKNLVDSVSVFNYKEIQGTGLFDMGTEPSRFFNTLFFLMVPSFGKGFSFLQRKTVKQFLDEKIRKMIGIDSVILEPTFIEIDVQVLYTVKDNSSPILAQNELYTSIYSFFQRSKRQLGENITVSALRNAIDTTNISGLEIQLKRDEDSVLNAADYDVDITPDEYEDVFAEVEAKKLDDAVKRELRNLIGKGVIQISQPLFDVQKKTGEREWLFVNDIALGRFEFPILGDVVVERRV